MAQKTAQKKALNFESPLRLNCPACFSFYYIQLYSHKSTIISAAASAASRRFQMTWCNNRNRLSNRLVFFLVHRERAREKIMVWAIDVSAKIQLDARTYSNWVKWCGEQHIKDVKLKSKWQTSWSKLVVRRRRRLTPKQQKKEGREKSQEELSPVFIPLRKLWIFYTRFSSCSSQERCAHTKRIKSLCVLATEAILWCRLLSVNGRARERANEHFGEWMEHIGCTSLSISVLVTANRVGQSEKKAAR